MKGECQMIEFNSSSDIYNGKAHHLTLVDGLHDCPKLEGLSREEGRELFPRLRKIDIAYCPKLSFPHLSAPKELSLVGDYTTGLNSISNLNSLTSLTIGYDDKTVCFPKEFLRNLTLLESLVIENYYELKVLPGDLASLVTLKSLKIIDCPKLESLPEEGLRGLQSLLIINCYELERRCEKGKGEDWYKIAHIPKSLLLRYMILLLLIVLLVGLQL
ncbi:hypothetical protein TEA_024182 [Camellia sinensis var. sinensis]|uniref:NB-ARC domain-containing protein n=1 Tax=Camellia sinensis var. sinensis TaxID=542762 RepID=A0A4S4F0F3_CAMSN|nr:hypothetical protein TEA_024182 [Camellia sinensis var. sinensis]